MCKTSDYKRASSRTSRYSKVIVLLTTLILQVSSVELFGLYVQLECLPYGQYSPQKSFTPIGTSKTSPDLLNPLITL